MSYYLPFFISAILIFITGLFTLRKFNFREGRYLSGVCFSATVWAFTEGMLYLGFDIETCKRITYIQYVGIAFLPPFALLFGLSIYCKDSWVSKKARLPLLVIAVTIILLVWTNPLHHFVFTQYYSITTAPFPMLGLNHGILWWAIISYHYLLVAILSAILVCQTITSSGYLRSQAIITLSAVAFVWIANIVYVSGKSPVPNMDISPLAFVLVGGAMAWGFYRYKWLDILPVAKTKIFQSLDDIIFVLNDENRILDINQAAESTFTLKASQLIGRETSQALKNYPRLTEALTGMESSEIVLNLDSREKVYDRRISNITDKKGKDVGKIIVLHDITARKRAETSLKQSEERYRSLIENTMDGYFICEIPSGQFVFLNQRACNLYGYTLEEGLTLTIWDVMASGDHKRIQRRMKNRLEGNELSSEIQKYTSIMKDGSTFLVEISTSLIQFQGHPMVQGVVRDITEKERLEQQLQQSKKMEAIGLLAGGVAHDLNNVLSGIVSYPDLLLSELPQNSPLRKPIRTIHSSGQKAAEIVQDLLTLARRGVSAKNIVNLNAVVSDYLKSPECDRLKVYHRNITIETDLAENLFNIEGSATQLIKLVMNLVSNAAEAQPTGGNILIATYNQYVDKPFQGYEEIEEGDFAVLEIADNGIGIANEDIDRIFEPFYTKKVMGRSGTGLGMAVVWGTIHDHNGHIDIKSTEGIGTTFSLYFPARRNAKALKKEIIPIDEYMGQMESILVIDDIAEQREIASSILAKLNYSVTTVSSGEAAVEYLKDNTVDLLILDMIMAPGIDGLETYRRIQLVHPNQKAIIASGFSETDRVREAQKLGAGAYIRKPYNLEQIGIAVKNALLRN